MTARTVHTTHHLWIQDETPIARDELVSFALELELRRDDLAL
jgi:hypothetical protein